MKREIDKRDNVRVVTSNQLIVADGLASLSLNAKKLLYLAISQCRKDDKEFYEYSISPSELAVIFGTSRQRIYQETDAITDELMRLFVKCGKESKRYFKKLHVFESCEYDEERLISFALHRDMTNLLLGLTGDYSQPVLWDFMRMRSRHSLAIWHLMQREMQSMLPSVISPVEFELTLQELREATGTENKLERISQFKAKVLNVAIKEIRENLLADIVYDDVKTGHKITGFRFTAVSCLGIVDKDNLTLRDRQRIRKAQLVRKKAAHDITEQEKQELEMIEHELYQMRIDDIYS